MTRLQNIKYVRARSGTLLCVLAFGLQATHLRAQQDSALTRQLTISREYAPETTSAIKMDLMPDIDEPQTERTTATFAIMPPTTSNARSLSVLSAQQVVATPNPYTHGWVKGDLGNYWNGNIDAGYRWREFLFTAKGNITSSDEMRWYDNAPKVFGYNKYYPQYLADGTTLNPEAKNLLPGNRWDNSFLMRGNFRINYEHVFFNDARIRAYAGTAGEQLHMLTDNCEQQFGLIEGGVGYDWEDLTLQADYGRTGVRLPGETNHDLMLKAQYGWYDDDLFKYQVGLRYGNTWTEHNYYATIKGYGQVNYYPTPDQLNRIYLNVEVGSERPRLYELLDRLPLALNMQGFGTTTDMKAELGWEANEVGAFQWGLFAGLHQSWNCVTGVMLVHPLSQRGQTALTAEPITPYPYLGPYMALVNHDCLKFFGGMHFDYELNNYLEAKADAVANLHSCALTEPDDYKLGCNISLSSHPIKQLEVELCFVGKFLREGTISTNYEEPKHKQYREKVNLHNITDLGLRAEYHMLDNLSVYAQACNMLCQRYELWAGVPAQKLNWHVGASWRF